MTERKFDFKTLVNKKVSIMLLGKNDKKETYVGLITDVYDDFVELKCKVEPNDNFPISGIIIRKDVILSVWFYRDTKP